MELLNLGCFLVNIFRSLSFPHYILLSALGDQEVDPEDYDYTEQLGDD